MARRRHEVRGSGLGKRRKCRLVHAEARAQRVAVDRDPIHLRLRQIGEGRPYWIARKLGLACEVEHGTEAV